MRKNAKERYHSAAEMMRDIDEFKRNPSIKFDYSYFVDNAPTKYVSDTVGTSAAAARTSDTPEEGKKTAVKTQNKTMIILLGVIASIVVVAAIVAGIFLATQKKLEVPNFVGKNYAQEIMTDPQNTENFNFEIENTYSTDAEVGTVIKQTPEAGTMLRKGKTIKLYLAYNDEGILIEGIAGLTASEATARLKALGFTVQERLTYEKNMTPGIVAYCSPQEGSYAEKGSLVTIYIASDENPNAVKVPEVLGYNQDIAKQIIESAGFVVGNITQENSDKEAGTVIGQSPDSTEEATLGSKVDLVVSNGVPSESSATITISLPTVSGSAMGTVKIFVNSVLYGTYKDILLKGDAKTFEITGTGADNTFRVFLDDQEILTGKIDFTRVPAKITDVEETPYVVQEIVPSVVGISEQDARKRLNSQGLPILKLRKNTAQLW